MTASGKFAPLFVVKALLLLLLQVVSDDGARIWNWVCLAHASLNSFPQHLFLCMYVDVNANVNVNANTNS